VRFARGREPDQTSERGSVTTTDDMPDETTTIAMLKDAVRLFAVERDWESFHNPKNVAMALAIEASELMEPFLWVDGEESRKVAGDPAKRLAVADEMADVACLLFNMSLSTGIDLSDAIQSKMDRNALKYPAPKRD
jgi:NTP pyrophosphatase (non-canonical NTP hydrolase)